ncbi:MAG: hypothetical protein IJB94_04575 [Clostridia bacterium]|nr:hypothetical protein [Clostridia bacterium]
MKPVKTFFINLALLIGATALLRLLSVTVFNTIFNAIMGNPYLGAWASIIFVRICMMFANGLAICIPHARNAEARREFLDVLGAEKYDRKADFKALAKTKQFRNECIIFAILYIGVILLFKPWWICVIGILAFPFINLWHHTAVRKKWAGERIRFAPSEG